jgi:hypothetical protein
VTFICKNRFGSNLDNILIVDDIIMGTIKTRRRDSSVGIVTELHDRRSIPGRDRIFLFGAASRPALKPTKPPIRWVPVAVSVDVKQPEREADHSPPCRVEVKNTWRSISTPPHVFVAWCLIKYRRVHHCVVLS